MQQRRVSHTVSHLSQHALPFPIFNRFLGTIAEAAGLAPIDIHVPRATRVGNSIIQSDVRVAKAKDAHQLYEAVVELRKP